jgi:hypothetical protein
MALPDKILARKLLKKEKKKLKMLQEKAKQEKENPAKDVYGESRYPGYQNSQFLFKQQILKMALDRSLTSSRFR